MLGRVVALFNNINDDLHCYYFNSCLGSIYAGYSQYLPFITAVLK
jgi:hypothetical protein